MKTSITILKLESWKFKNEQGQELSGKSAVYLLEDYDLQRTTVKDEILKTIEKSQLPALFEVDIRATQKYNNGKSKLRYELDTVKFVKSVSIFGA